MSLHSALLPLLLLAQNPADEAAGPDTAWELVDQIQIIVNQDVLTLRRLEERVRLVLSRLTVSTREEMARLRSQIAEDEVRQLLMVQRGRELGFDPANVERTVRDFLDRQIEEEGGLSTYSDRLSSQDLSGTDRKRQVTDELYGLSYDRAVTGQSVGPDGRPIADRYVRPGLLRLHYERVLDDPESLEALGGRPESVVFRQLAVDAGQLGGPEAALARIEELRSQALSGDMPFEQLVVLYGAIKENGGLTEPLPLANLERADPELGRFAREAELEDLSPARPIRGEDRVLGYRVVQLVERLAPELPDFDDRQVQERLRNAILRQQDEGRRQRSLRDAFRSAYVWSPEGIRRPGEGEAAPAPAEAAPPESGASESGS